MLHPGSWFASHARIEENYIWRSVLLHLVGGNMVEKFTYIHLCHQESGDWLPMGVDPCLVQSRLMSCGKHQL